MPDRPDWTYGTILTKGDQKSMFLRHDRVWSKRFYGLDLDDGLVYSHDVRLWQPLPEVVVSEVTVNGTPIAHRLIGNTIHLDGAVVENGDSIEFTMTYDVP